MSEQAGDPLNEVEALVRAHLARQCAKVDGAAGLACVQHALATPLPVAVPRRRNRLFFALAAAAALMLAFFGFSKLGPAQASARELVEEAQRVHNLPLARCYLVEIQRVAADDQPPGEPVRQVHVWTRGDRFWAEMRRGDAGPAFIWGREENGALWAVLDSHNGVRVPFEQAPRPLQRIADLYTLKVDTLLNDVLQDCSLTESAVAPSSLTRMVVAVPRSERARLWLGNAELEIDTESRVLRRMVIVRNLLGKPLATVTFTLLETRPDDGTQYRLEGHLAEPIRVYEGNLEPKVKLALLARLLGAQADARAKKEPSAPALQVRDVDGNMHTPLAQTDKKAAVLFFLLPDCPISNSYAPEINRICADYAPKQVASFVVHADPDVSAREAKKHATEFGLTCPVLLDPAHLLVKKTGVTIAPEVAVLVDGKVLYRGRIDDWYAALGKRRPEPTQRDLRAALDAILQGKPVPAPTTQALGCYLPQPKQ
jgi:hypothetical protein